MALPAQGLFVTGTDTGVGKTLVASALIRHYVGRGLRTAGMKPVASGAFHDGRHWRNEDVDALCAAANVALPATLVNPYLLRRATAPHIAAEEEGVQIELARIVQHYGDIAQAADMVVVEGAGGLMVPLDGSHQLDDLAVALGLPIILVVGIRLGCINHALLTQHLIRSRGLVFGGWVANRIEPQENQAQAMIASLQLRLAAPLLGCIPWSPGIGAATVAALLDTSGLPPGRASVLSGDAPAAG